MTAFSLASSPSRCPATTSPWALRLGPVLARMGTLAPTGASALAFAWHPAPGTANLVSCARRPGPGDGAGDRARVDHVVGDVAEEEGQARVALHDVDEADLLADLAVVVADGRDGKAAGVGRPRGVDGDAVGAPACGRLPPPADEGQVLAHEAALGVLVKVRLF